jgi:hypothetical protein
MARFPVLLVLLRCFTIMENARFSPRIAHIDLRHQRMRIEENSKINGPLSSLPLLLGCLGCLLCGTYQAQRCGYFLDSFYTFDRFIQHHLDAFAGSAALTSLLGIVVGLVIHRIWRRSRIVMYGVIFSAATLLWATLGLSL